MPGKALCIAMVVCVLMGAAACGAGTSDTGPDAYEPNDDVSRGSTPLTPGVALRATIHKTGANGDRDSYSCPLPAAEGATGFRVRVTSFQADYLEVEVGISLPDAFEAITWPGWKPRRDGNAVVVEAQALGGTLLVFVSASRRLAYSIEIEPT